MSELGQIGQDARAALELGRQNERDIESHEAICAERYTNINDKLSTIFKIIAWAGGTGFLLIMGLLGFLAKTQFESINALQKVTVQGLERAQQPAPPPQVIIQPAQGLSNMGATVERTN